MKYVGDIIILFLYSGSYQQVVAYFTYFTLFNMYICNFLQVNVKIVTPHKSGNEISVFLHIQKKEHIFEVTSAFTHGKNRLAVEGKFDLQPNNWNINMKVKLISISLSLKFKRHVQN
jgi:hypothetical protein